MPTTGCNPLALQAKAARNRPRSCRRTGVDRWGTPYFFAFLLSMVLLGVFGFGVERYIYRTVKGGIEPTLVALLALTTFLQAAGYPVFGPLDKDVPSVFTGTHNILGVLVSAERLVIIPAAAVLVLGVLTVLVRWRPETSLAPPDDVPEDEEVTP